MTTFGGWEMPLSYPQGTVAEHLACRTGAALFDVSHLGTVRVSGPSAHERLQGAFTNDLGRIGPGRAQYTHLLGDDGAVLDDIIVWWRSDELFDVIPNAANTDRVRGVVGGDDVTATRALLAVQGPEARQVVAAAIPDAPDVGRFRVGEWEQGTVAGTGYTGEQGVELAVPPGRGVDLWDRLVAAGARPAGLGARDTLRLEAGLPLHGHDLGPGITPLQAGLGWVVAWDKGPFPGRDALLQERERGPERLLRGLRGTGRRPLRDGSPIRMEGAEVGELTSGGFSPVLEVGIGLGFVPAGTPVGSTVDVDVRGSAVPATVVDPPFVPLPSTP